MRGKYNNKPKRTSEDTENSVRDHIELFERIESYYCQSNSTREYLDETLNMSKMYALYKEYMAKNRPTATIVTEY